MRTKDRVTPKTSKAIVADEADIPAMNHAARVIRRLPGVLRVRVNPAESRVEVLYKHPTEIWLREIHLAVSSLADTMNTLAAYCS